MIHVIPINDIANIMSAYSWKYRIMIKYHHLTRSQGFIFNRLLYIKSLEE